MTNIVKSYTVPDLKIIVVSDCDKIPDYDPELTILDLGEGKMPRYIRIYRLCYLDRISLDQSVKSIKERDKVNKQSLCSKRTELVRALIKGYIEGQYTVFNFNCLETGLNWIDYQKRSDELNSSSGCRTLYREYTEYLRHRLRISNIVEKSNRIEYSTAQSLQSAMALVCALNNKIDKATVQSWAVLIPRRKLGANELPVAMTTADEHALSQALHQRFFDAFSEAVINDAKPPVVVKLADLGFEDLIFYSKHANSANGWSSAIKDGRTDWQPFFYQGEGVFNGTLKEFNTLLAQNNIPSLKNKAFSRLQKDNHGHFSRHSLYELANNATRHFGYLFLAEAGCNASHLASLDCEQVRLDKVLGVASTRAVKGRANNELQDQFVDVRFAKNSWKKYLKLREWMIQCVESPPTRGLFLLGKRANKPPLIMLTAASMSSLPLWPNNAPSLRTRAARKHKTINLIERSEGNIALVGSLQFATSRTIESHYSFKSVVESAKEMCEFFDAKAKSVELRQSGIQPIRIIEEGETIHTGRCDSDDEAPQIVEGFEALGIEPRCGAPITCMFCKHFALHADVDDFIRILSVKHWIQTQSRLSSVNIDDHYEKYLPYINRIDQIIQEILSSGGSSADYMSDALLRFDGGHRDQYWKAKINALIDMEHY